MITTSTIEARGLAFTVRATGPADGEPVLLLHGFPDDAATFDDQLEALGAAGHRCLAPTLRGYEPSSQPADGDFDALTLAGDVIGWLDALGIERAHIVGHDWGAVIAYLVAGHHADRCISVTTMAVPPVTRLPEAIRRVPRQALLSWYMTFFQLRWVAERALRARRWALLRRFWPRWSPGLDAPPRLVETFERPGVLGAALAYYRQNATPPVLLGLRQAPAMEQVPFDVPLMVMHGDRDGCIDARLFDHAIVADDVPQGVRRHVVTGTGHFLHLEDPDEVNRLLLEWLADPTP
ncbi:MAG: alpha/beta hydrolase [Actinomycetota bacterium]